jgi:nitrogen regulatory protein P-II 1
MKRIEAFVQSDKTQSAVSAIEKIGVGGITILNARGRGKGQRPTLQSGRGTGYHIAEYNTIDALVTIVDDSKVNEVVSTLAKAASTGSKGDGKIFVSNVESAVDIGSNNTGQTAL